MCSNSRRTTGSSDRALTTRAPRPRNRCRTPSSCAAPWPGVCSPFPTPCARSRRRARDRRGRRRQRCGAEVGGRTDHSDIAIAVPDVDRLWERPWRPAARWSTRWPTSSTAIAPAAPRPVRPPVDAQHPHRGRRSGRDGPPDAGLVRGTGVRQAIAHSAPSVRPSKPRSAGKASVRSELGSVWDCARQGGAIQRTGPALWWPVERWSEQDRCSQCALKQDVGGYRAMTAHHSTFAA
jgi:hypothetical protein